MLLRAQLMYGSRAVGPFGLTKDGLRDCMAIKYDPSAPLWNSTLIMT